MVAYLVCAHGIPNESRAPRRKLQVGEKSAFQLSLLQVTFDHRVRERTFAFAKVCGLGLRDRVEPSHSRRCEAVCSAIAEYTVSKPRERRGSSRTQRVNSGPFANAAGPRDREGQALRPPQSRLHAREREGHLGPATSAAASAVFGKSKIPDRVLGIRLESRARKRNMQPH